MRKARFVQGVEAKAGLPPARRALRPQLSLLYPKDHPKRPKGDLKELRAWAEHRRQSWDMSVRIAWQSVVSNRYWEAANWDEFITACVLYDPPELKLAEFAGYGSEGSSPEALPIEWVDSRGHRVVAMEEFYQGLLEELDRRHFKPRGEDIWQEVSEIYNETDLLEKLQTKMREAETHPYIAVSKGTSDDDILCAAREIRATQAKDSGGRPPRDKLLAIKCAALYNDHNYKDPNTGRWRWTYEGLVEELGLDPAEKDHKVNKKDPKERERRKAIAKEYVKLGEECQKERSINRGI